jgi:hypothetical protein
MKEKREKLKKQSELLMKELLLNKFREKERKDKRNLIWNNNY